MADEAAKRRAASNTLAAMVAKLNEVSEQSTQNTQALEDINGRLESITRLLSGVQRLEAPQGAAEEDEGGGELANPREQLSEQERYIYDNISLNRDRLERITTQLDELAHVVTLVKDALGELRSAASDQGDVQRGDVDELGGSIRSLDERVTGLAEDITSLGARLDDVRRMLGGVDYAPGQGPGARKGARGQARPGSEHMGFEPRVGPMSVMGDVEGAQERALARQVDELERAVKDVLTKLGSLTLNIRDAMGDGVEAANAASGAASQAASRIETATGSLRQLVLLAVGLSAFSTVGIVLIVILQLIA